MLSSLLSWFCGRFPTASQRTLRKKRTALRVEALEDRTVLAAGVLDPTFGTGGLVTTDFAPTGNEITQAMMVQTDSKIVVTGQANGKAFVGRYNADGTLDTTFGSGGKAYAGVKNAHTSQGLSVAIQPDGKYIVVGQAVSAVGWNNDSDFLIMRFNANGTLDNSFDKDGIVTTGFGRLTRDVAWTVAVQPSGKLVVGGITSAAEGFSLVRYNANGSLDTSFGSGGRRTYNLPGAYDSLVSMAVQVDGKIVLAGNTDTGATLLRVDANGNADGTFFPGQAGTASDVALDPTGRIVVAGDRFVSGLGNRQVVVRYNSDGSLDTSFAGDGVQDAAGLARSVVVQLDNKIVTAGYTTGGPSSDMANLLVTRFNADGTLDAGFGTGGMVTTTLNAYDPLNPDANGGGEWLAGVGLQADGRIVLAANDVYPQHTLAKTVIARYLSAAPQIGSFTANPNPVATGGVVTLTASNITDANPGSVITQVAFYSDSNDNGILDPGDELLGYGAQSGGDWSFSFIIDFGPGTRKLFAQASDSFAVFGDPAVVDLQVN